MLTIKELKQWLSEFPEEATVSFYISPTETVNILSLYPLEDVRNKRAKHVCIDLGNGDV